MSQTVSSLTGTEVFGFREISGNYGSLQSGDATIIFTSAAAAKSFALPLPTSAQLYAALVQLPQFAGATLV